LPVGEGARIISAMHLAVDSLEAGLADIIGAPTDNGTVELIVRRPGIDQREVLSEAILDPVEGLIGDTWKIRPSRKMNNTGPHPEMQLNIMNARAIALIAGTKDRWALAGDQLYIDFDISETSLPAGSRLRVGTALIQVSAVPHTGCVKFADRFGPDARRFVNTPHGRALRLRGMNAWVIEGGIVRSGDAVTKV
jgi:hypothetical protein